MKLPSVLVAAALVVAGFSVPAQASTNHSSSPRQACLLDDCHYARESYPIDIAGLSGMESNLQHVITASDGKVWFLGIPYGSNDNFVGYIKPWDTVAGVHVCSNALLGTSPNKIEPTVLVAENDGRVQAIASPGKVITYNSDCTSATYSTTTQLTSALVAARDARGHIWVSDYNSSTVVDITASASVQSVMAVGIESGPDGQMWAIDQIANQVVNWDPANPAGATATSLSGACSPRAIASDSSRYLWITCDISDVLVRVDPQTTPPTLQYWGVPTGGPTGLPGIAISRDANAWLTDQGDGQVRAFVLANASPLQQIDYFNYEFPSWSTTAPHLAGITTDFDSNAWFLNAKDSTINFIGVNPVGPNPNPSSCSSSASWTVYFAIRSAKLSPSTKATLDCVASLASSAKSIKIYGYTMTNNKSETSKSANKALAKRRANAVKAYLRAHGVTAKIVVIAKGAVHPASLTNQAKNRRVVVVPKFLRLLTN